MDNFFPGLDHPSDAKHFRQCMISIAALRSRKSDFEVGRWILDSGAFMEIKNRGDFRDSPEEYAAQIRRWWRCGLLLAAVTQDYMCEPFILNITGKTVEDHQRMTIERYDRIKAAVGPMVYVMPVLQGFEPDEYVSHLRQYGSTIANGAWVGVGSVCKRNARVEDVEHVFMAIRKERPDLRLHGFGIKITSLESSIVRMCLFSADSMAWSRAARWEGRDNHDWREAQLFADKIASQKVRRREFQARMF